MFKDNSIHEDIKMTNSVIASTIHQIQIKLFQARIIDPATSFKYFYEKKYTTFSACVQHFEWPDQ